MPVPAARRDRGRRGREVAGQVEVLDRFVRRAFVARGNAQHVDAQCPQRRQFRAEVDDRSETLGYRIREAENQKIPLTLLIGDEEQTQGTVARRLRRSKKALEAISASTVVETLRVANAERRPSPFA